MSNTTNPKYNLFISNLTGLDSESPIVENVEAEELKDILDENNISEIAEVVDSEDFKYATIVYNDVVVTIAVVENLGNDSEVDAD